MNKKKILFLAILVCSFLFISSVKAEEPGGVSSYEPTITGEETTPAPTYTEVQSINPSGAPFFFPTYNETRVSIIYAEAVSYFVNVTSIDTHHYEMQSPTGMTAILNGLATYHLVFNVYYNQVVNQSVTLTVLSGDGKETTLPIDSPNNMGFTLEVVIASSVEPHYPSPEEVWEYGSAQQQEMLWNMTQSFQQQQETATVVQYGTVAVVVIVVAIIVLVIRHIRRNDSRLNNLTMRLRS